MRIRKILILVASISLLSACVSTASAGKTTSGGGIKFSPIAHARTVELLDFIAIYPELAPETQKNIALGITKELAKHENESDIKLQIQQGAILSLPNSKMRDTVAAQQVLQQLLNSNALSESDTSLVKLLLTLALDHNKQQIKKRDEAKNIDILKRKNKALVQKLNDLKNIEKTMTERNVQTNSSY
ncbi:MAG: hypothetical protein COB34_06915 [Methylophilaceae bacterium]|nr:MAG: hypothetical protein COB34_06915 [Methylophilaceae bacterium]